MSIDEAGGETTLWRGAGFRVGLFRCPLSDWRWRDVNCVGSEPYVVFPHVPVLIEHDRRYPVLATANHVMLYDAWQGFRRSPVMERGDRCAFVAVEPDTLAAVAPRLAGSFGRVEAPVDAVSYAVHAGLVRHLSGGAADGLLVEETALRLLTRVLGRLQPEPPARRRGRRELAEAAKRRLATRATAGDALEDLARDLAVSPYHLWRVFRAETGYSLHGYRTQLRLRLALDRLDASRGDLTRLAIELGFSSHSHFTRSFRASFGMPPSRFAQARLGRRELGRLAAPLAS